MEAIEVMPRTSPCGGPLPEHEVPMINTMVNCLINEHRRLDEQIIELALAASRLGANPHVMRDGERAAELWNSIQHDLWSHLQIEDEVVLTWGEAHHAMGAAFLGTLQREREELRKLIATLPAWNAIAAVEYRESYAKTLLEIAQKLDSHVALYDSEVLPAILRALFNRRDPPLET